MNYEKSGVNIAAGDALVDWIKETQPKELPHQERVVSGIGGFASLFSLKFPEMKEPCLVTCTDGIGTKIKLAAHFEKYASVGQDLVAMSVNDLICCGAKPLLFLDYYACGKLELEAAKEFVGGVRRACIDSNCFLIGGETAEMPGVYQGKDFDSAGFAVGVVDKEKALGPEKVKDGSRLIAVASNGFHSNGFSLLRKVFERDLDDWRDELLKPTALYPKLAEDLCAGDGDVQAMAHITGGGIANLTRVLPNGATARLKMWELSSAYREVQKRAGLSDEELLKTFNCGVGLIIVARADSVSGLIEKCQKNDFAAWELGRVEGDAEKAGEKPRYVFE